MKSLNRQLGKLQSFIEFGEKINIKVSKANVAWHIEHSLMVIIKMIEAVCKSEPDKYRWQFNFKRELVFILREFPRGRGKAPDDVNPKQNSNPDFQALFEKAYQAIEKLEQTQPYQFYSHTIFGKLHRNNVFRLLDIHTRHHAHIIKDILSHK